MWAPLEGEPVDKSAPGDAGSQLMNGAPGSGDDVDVLAVCEAHGWNASRVAEALGIHRSTFWRRLRAQGISLRRRKGTEPEPGRSAPERTAESWAAD